MKCPHCSVEIHPSFSNTRIGQPGLSFEERSGKDMIFVANAMKCPACKRGIVFLNIFHNGAIVEAFQVYPANTAARRAAPEVPRELADDFNEAGAVLSISTKASAALSRRCLQQILRLQGYMQHDLAKQIDAVLASNTLPAALSLNVDAVRNIGNFAAHPLKDTNSGAIAEVEPEEAEWNLDVLEGLFDYYYVQPAQDLARRNALNVKLAALGKPAIK